MEVGSLKPVLNIPTVCAEGKELLRCRNTPMTRHKWIHVVFATKKCKLFSLLTTGWCLAGLFSGWGRIESVANDKVVNISGTHDRVMYPTRDSIYGGGKWGDGKNRPSRDAVLLRALMGYHSARTDLKSSIYLTWTSVRSSAVGPLIASDQGFWESRIEKLCHRPSQCQTKIPLHAA